jgi:hypothetical protein
MPYQDKLTEDGLKLEASVASTTSEMLSGAGPSRTAVASIISALALIVGITIENPATAQIIRATIDGLPSGLHVSLRGEFLRCGPTSVTPINAGAINLVEHTIYTFQSLPGGLAGDFHLVAQSRYVGQMTVNPPAASETGCSNIVNAKMRVFVGILEDAGLRGHTNR